MSNDLLEVTNKIHELVGRLAQFSEGVESLKKEFLQQSSAPVHPISGGKLPIWYGSTPSKAIAELMSSHDEIIARLMEMKPCSATCDCGLGCILNRSTGHRHYHPPKGIFRHTWRNPETRGIGPGG